MGESRTIGIETPCSPKGFQGISVRSETYVQGKYPSTFPIRAAENRFDGIREISKLECVTVQQADVQLSHRALFDLERLKLPPLARFVCKFGRARRAACPKYLQAPAGNEPASS